jgi:hypothetical protein
MNASLLDCEALYIREDGRIEQAGISTLWTPGDLRAPRYYMRVARRPPYLLAPMPAISQIAAKGYTQPGPRQTRHAPGPNRSAQRSPAHRQGAVLPLAGRRPQADTRPDTPISLPNGGGRQHPAPSSSMTRSLYITQTFSLPNADSGAIAYAVGFRHQPCTVRRAGASDQTSMITGTRVPGIGEFGMAVLVIEIERQLGWGPPPADTTLSALLES